MASLSLAVGRGVAHRERGGAARHRGKDACERGGCHHNLFRLVQSGITRVLTSTFVAAAPFHCCAGGTIRSSFVVVSVNFLRAPVDCVAVVSPPARVHLVISPVSHSPPACGTVCSTGKRNLGTTSSSARLDLSTHSRSLPARLGTAVGDCRGEGPRGEARRRG